MKKILVVVLLLALVALPGFSAYNGGTPIVGGGTGIITVPTTSTIGQGGLDVGFYYVGPDTIALSAGFGFINNLDLSLGLELDDGTASPYIQIRGKYRFSSKRSSSWAGGLDIAMATGDTVYGDDLKISPYIVNSFYISAIKFQFTWGAGFTFEDGNDSSINFFVGLSKKLVKGIYLEMDFSNYATRYFQDFDANNASRGIGNIAARFHLFDGLLRLSLGLFDVFDANRVFGLGAALKLNFK